MYLGAFYRLFTNLSELVCHSEIFLESFLNLVYFIVYLTIFFENGSGGATSNICERPSCILVYFIGYLPSFLFERDLGYYLGILFIGYLPLFFPKRIRGVTS